MHEPVSTSLLLPSSDLVASPLLVADFFRRPVAEFFQGERDTMADLIFIGVTIVFFAVAWAYALGCDRL
jgi:hypothetical protein